MKNIVLPGAVCLALMASAIAAASPQSTPDVVFGTWINPRGSVAVKTADCKGHLCGWVSWANADAISDSRSGGVSNLVGTALLRDYSLGGSGMWRGRVFVPDMGRTFYSTILPEGPNVLKISGCILGGLLCKSQDWHRVSG